MKKLFLLCSFVVVTLGYADELSDILSNNKKSLFDYQFQDNEAKSNTLENSWINPIMLQYRKNYSKQFTDKTVKTGSFTVGIDQPIFRSGGIYFAIKYAKALRGANEAEIRLKKREMIMQAVKILFEIKKLRLEKKKLARLIKNDSIDIRQKSESYEAGLIDSSFLDQALLNKHKDETNLLELETSLMTLEKNFSLLSDKNPSSLKLPKLNIIPLSKYKDNNLELARDRLRAEEKAYNSKMTWAKYMPTISVQARYTDEDLNPLFARPGMGIEEQYFTYGFSISMPLNINMFSDVEASKVEHLKAETEVIDRKYTLGKEYKLIRSKLNLIDKKIILAKKGEKLYQRLYKSTYNLEKVGEKTSFDTSLMRNSLEIKKIDKQIYAIDKQILLLDLYTKVGDDI
ncbi:MAG: TolC family protein [Sulfurovum sp.]|nr:TolC family protein [Sulfurovum sp.]